MLKVSVSPAFNTSWVVATCLCVWFLCIHAPVALAAKHYIQPLLYLHLVGAYSIYIACVHNTIMTPSALDGAARPFHIWIGRSGLVLGVIGFITGFVLVWFIYDFTQNLGWSIGITSGGIAQMQLEFMGYRAIRRFQKIKAQIGACKYTNEEELIALQDEQDAQLKIHVQSMINLFVLACGIPALMRICEAISYTYLPILLIIVYCLSYLMARTFLEKIKAKRFSERNIDESTLIIK
mmetsp:Transcript_21123/g.38218  ORF Transcript_21123/g.38218 Transcript_21123/m.38218 type:complete len:237 (+) Transcript_21123:40-750(+)